MRASHRGTLHGRISAIYPKMSPDAFMSNIQEKVHIRNPKRTNYSNIKIIKTAISVHRTSAKQFLAVGMTYFTPKKTEWLHTFHTESHNNP